MSGLQAGGQPIRSLRGALTALAQSEPYRLLAAHSEEGAEVPRLPANAVRIAGNLVGHRVPEGEARAAGATCVFTRASGRCGTGLDAAALATAGRLVRA